MIYTVTCSQKLIYGKDGISEKGKGINTGGGASLSVGYALEWVD